MDLQFSQGHALIIGVGADLECTVSDAKGLAQILTDKERCAYPTGQVVLLTEIEASATKILNALNNLAVNTDEKATVIIYFSGHGCFFCDDYYLVPNGCNWQKLAETAISGKQLAAKIAAISASKKIIFLDCCHAGGVGNVKASNLRKDLLPLKALDLFEQGKGYVIIGSSREVEVSYTGNPFSVFTGALIEALCGKGVAKKDGYVRVADLAGYTRERVARLTKEKQHPVFHFEQADNFVISYYAAGEINEKALPFTLQFHNEDDTASTSLAEALKSMEDLFVEARYERAYSQFHSLSKNYPDYQIQAGMILSRYHEFENQVISGVLTRQQQNITNLEIALSFQKCLAKFSLEHCQRGAECRK